MFSPQGSSGTQKWQGGGEGSYYRKDTRRGPVGGGHLHNCSVPSLTGFISEHVTRHTETRRGVRTANGGFRRTRTHSPNGITLDKEKILSMLLEQVFLEFDSVSHCQTQ